MVTVGTSAPLVVAFRGLSGDEQASRMNAAQKLVDVLFDESLSAEDALGKGILGTLGRNGVKSLKLPEECGMKLEYAVPRLIRGLGASDDTTRAAFSVALTNVLVKEEKIPTSVVFSLLEETQNANGLNPRGARDCWLARVFCIRALDIAKRLVADVSDAQRAVTILVDVSSKGKNNMMEEPAFAVLSGIMCTADPGQAAEMLGCLSPATFASKSEMSPAAVALILTVAADHPTLVKKHLKALGVKVVDGSVVVDASFMKKLSAQLKAAVPGGGSQGLHALWRQVVKHASSTDVASVWTWASENLMGEGTRADSHALAVRVLCGLLMICEDLEAVSVLINRPNIKFLSKAARSPRAYLATSTKLALADVATVVSQHSELGINIVTAVGPEVVGSFDSTTQSGVIAAALAGFSPEENLQYVEKCITALCAAEVAHAKESKEEPLVASAVPAVAVETDSVRVRIITHLTSLVRGLGKEHQAAVASVVGFATRLALHDATVKVAAAGAKSGVKLSLTPVSVTPLAFPSTVQLTTSSQVGLFALIASLDGTAKDSACVPACGSTWASTAVHISNRLQKNGSVRVLSKAGDEENTTLHLHSDDEDSEAEEDVEMNAGMESLRTAMFEEGTSQINKLTSTRSKILKDDAKRAQCVQLRAFEGLISNVWLRMPQDLDLCEILNDLLHASNSLLQLTKDVNEDGPSPVAVVVDAILALLTHESSGLRRVATAVFRSLIDQLGDTAMRVISATLVAPARDGGEVMDIEEDDSEDEEENIPEGEEKVDNTSKAGSKPSSKRTPETEDEEPKVFTITSSLIPDDVGGSLDEQPTPEEMAAMDRKIVEILKAGKNAKLQHLSIRQSDIHARGRVLNLIDTLARERSTPSVVIGLFAPLFIAHSLYQRQYFGKNLAGRVENTIGRLVSSHIKGANLDSKAANRALVEVAELYTKSDSSSVVKAMSVILRLLTNSAEAPVEDKKKGKKAGKGRKGKKAEVMVLGVGQVDLKVFDSTVVPLVSKILTSPHLSKSPGLVKMIFSTFPALAWRCSSVVATAAAAKESSTRATLLSAELLTSLAGQKKYLKDTKGCDLATHAKELSQATGNLFSVVEEHALGGDNAWKSARVKVLMKAVVAITGAVERSFTTVEELKKIGWSASTVGEPAKVLFTKYGAQKEKSPAVMDLIARVLRSKTGGDNGEWVKEYTSRHQAERKARRNTLAAARKTAKAVIATKAKAAAEAKAAVKAAAKAARDAAKAAAEAEE